MPTASYYHPIHVILIVIKDICSHSASKFQPYILLVRPYHLWALIYGTLTKIGRANVDISTNTPPLGYIQQRGQRRYGVQNMPDTN